MATATARMTVGSLFATVGTAANAVTSVLNTGVQGISMLDRYVKDASERQMIRSDVDMAEFEQRLMEEKAQESAQRQTQVEQFCEQSPRHAELYQENYDRIGKILAERKAARQKAA